MVENSDTQITQESMKEAFEQLQQAIIELVDAIVEVLQPILEAVLRLLYPVYIQSRREKLYHSIPSWLMSDWLVWEVAQRWPERWLPQLE